ncbi:Uncharacterized protein OBRU01_06665 [Operophtera brumata]|uniref:Uncharacterized protein n=1 Tax=Operophtera brumata TaxID=104452 RepID=A0A0L7LL37_OPEBR|nr:Uncharacterized protein OBRU01_06665 [Operophtera brumata]
MLGERQTRTTETDTQTPTQHSPAEKPALGFGNMAFRKQRNILYATIYEHAIDCLLRYERPFRKLRWMSGDNYGKAEPISSPDTIHVWVFDCGGVACHEATTPVLGTIGTKLTSSAQGIENTTRFAARESIDKTRLRPRTQADAHFQSSYTKRVGVRPQNKGHKVKDGALRTALSPIAIYGRAAQLPIGVGATMPTQPRVGATKVTELQRSITT